MTEKTASNCKLCSLILWRSRWVEKKILCKIKQTTVKNPNQALFDIDFVREDERFSSPKKIDSKQYSPLISHFELDSR